ncbi:PP2C family protein-serine/threonine phosphatase [Streptomyces longispororuber]|uniref:PP2C family protein-serine/threonine phosphatase n=1 Tax=Streptomyces longispororuber TaxID=68230 RepID=UPI00210EFFCE|nr:fused response regulator/phosphatase [Streptomyces longispororuber]MCQ4209409.1 fused response regulator/phosphatase [Streptomyces longispororuber]
MTTARSTLGPNATILVVDDHEPNRLALGSVLRRAGYRVMEAATASETMAALHRSELPPEMAIIDVRLPVTSGFELARQIATDPKLPPIPVVHISAEANGPQDRIRGLEGGASAYLASPVAPEELLSTVERVLLARREEQAAHDERRFASDLQHAFLPRPQKLAALEGIDLAVGYVPAMDSAQLGGDFYAAFAVERGVLLAVGDVAGHSLAAATVMVELRHVLRAYALEGHEPHRILQLMDRLLVHFHPEITATMCLLVLDTHSGAMDIANAGHLPPLVISPDGGTDYLPVHGPLLGLNLDHKPATPARLDDGDLLLMVTDGLIERPRIDLAVSLEDLRRRAATLTRTPQSLRDALLRHYSEDAEDDIALLAVRRKVTALA